MLNFFKSKAALAAMVLSTLTACTPGVEGTYSSKLGSVTLKDGTFTQSTMGIESTFKYEVQDDKIVVAVSEHSNLVYKIDENGDLTGPMGMVLKKQKEQ